MYVYINMYICIYVSHICISDRKLPFRFSKRFSKHETFWASAGFFLLWVYERAARETWTVAWNLAMHLCTYIYTNVHMYIDIYIWWCLFCIRRT